eukprot:GHVN01056690.1.p1 GENE.GHVN01056690.1~~GHVN01056690.1.p1  ORF type:complete len:282 (+),score=33.31 GHVN01056690.1:2132-2977(+)
MFFFLGVIVVLAASCCLLGCCGGNVISAFLLLGQGKVALGKTAGLSLGQQTISAIHSVLRSVDPKLVNHAFQGLTGLRFPKKAALPASSSLLPHDSPFTVPEGFYMNHRSVILGSGEQVYKTACQYLNSWDCVNKVPGSWVRFVTLPSSQPTATSPPKPQTNNLVGVESKAWFLPVWCQVTNVVVVDLSDAVITINGTDQGVETIKSCSTLSGHLLEGEESFSVIWNQQSDVVSFEVFSFSRPAGMLGWVASMIGMKALQIRFVEDVTDTMKRLCDDAVTK